MPLGTKGVSIISSYNNTSYLLLNLVSRAEQMLLGLNHCKDLVKVTHHASQIHRANDFCLFCDSFSQFVIIHLNIILQAINHHHLTTYMLCYRSSGGIGICRNYDLIFRTNTNQAKCHFHGRRGRIQANSLVGSHVSSYLLLKLFSLRTSCNPTT